MRANIILTLTLLCVALPAGAQPRGHGYKDWIAVCDNVRTCTAIGFSTEEDLGNDLGVGLTLVRAGEAVAEPQVSILLLTGEGGVSTWRLDVDGKAVSTITARQDEAKLTVEQSRVLLNAINSGSKLDIVKKGKLSGRVSLAGSTAALRWVDDQQRRAGTVTALAAKGPKPAAAVPAPPPLPVVRPGPAVPQTNLPKAPPAALRAVVRACEEPGDIERRFEVHRLSADVLFWLIPCGSGAYNYASRPVFTDAKGAILKGLSVGIAGDDLVNAEYSPETRTLMMHAKQRGVGDCGVAATWVWTGATFAKTEQTQLDECRGLNDWPTTYRARVVTGR